MLEDNKDKNNQLDLDKLCSIMTQDQKEEQWELMKAMVVRLMLNKEE